MSHQLVIALCVLIAAVAIIANQMPSVSKMDTVNRRINDIVNSGGPPLARGRKRTAGGNKSLLNAFISWTVNKLDLRKHMSVKDYKAKLFQAGYRSPHAETTFLFARAITPIIFALLAIIYLFALSNHNLSPLVKMAIVIAAAYGGVRFPELIIQNTMTKRRQEISDAWPDALDLMVICVEAGMTPEVSLRRVAREISLQSVVLASELNYTLAELSTLPDRSQAYENLAERTNIDQIKSTCSAFIQGETQGAPIASALRAMSSESRKIRLQNAKAKAAGMGPKMTVPMIVFLIPLTLAIIILPAAINALGMQ